MRPHLETPIEADGGREVFNNAKKTDYILCEAYEATETHNYYNKRRMQQYPQCSSRSYENKIPVNPNTQTDRHLSPCSVRILSRPSKSYRQAIATNNAFDIKHRFNQGQQIPKVKHKVHRAYSGLNTEERQFPGETLNVPQNQEHHQTNYLLRPNDPSVHYVNKRYGTIQQTHRSSNEIPENDYSNANLVNNVDGQETSNQLRYRKHKVKASHNYNNANAVIPIQECKNSSNNVEEESEETINFNPILNGDLRKASPVDVDVDKESNVNTVPDGKSENWGPEHPGDEHKATTELTDSSKKENLSVLDATFEEKNISEKTPMCLLNDLARYNKISFQYRLTNEIGPAHCKRFTVTLKLGDEQYIAEGCKIKQAQHMAAKEAILKTKYKHPVPKTSRRNNEFGVTPTVELNALAMKMGQQTYYLVDPREMPNPPPQPLPMPPHFTLSHPRHNQHNFPSRYQPRFPIVPSNVITRPPLHQINQFLPPPTPCKITLIVGQEKYIGTGKTLQQAKHDAAARALQVIKAKINDQMESSKEENDDKDEKNGKSPISVVFEIGSKRSLPVDFKVLREVGPAHMRKFTTACVVGSIVTEGEGTGKKNSKKRAAQKMLEELRKLPPLEPAVSPVKRHKLKNAERKIPKRYGNKSGQTTSDKSNPITKLLHWHHIHGEKEPTFELITEDNNKEKSRKQQFVVEVKSKGLAVRGTGSTKKLAKRNAAQNLMISLGIEAQSTESQSNLSPAKELDATSDEKSRISTKQPRSLSLDTIEEELVSANNKVPGILVLKQAKDNKDQKDITSNKSCETEAVHNEPKNKENKLECVNVAAEKVIESNNNVAVASSDVTLDSALKNDDTNSNNKKCTQPKVNCFPMKDQLLYLGNLLGFEVSYSDYPKGNHNEFLSIIMLSTNPPQICHGIGTSSEESREDAARCALKILSEMGLNHMKGN